VFPEPASSPDGKQIAFTGSDGNREVCITRVNGTHRQDITNDPANDYTPSRQPPPEQR
jgi:Tol biopolymer transport system component